MNVFKFIGRKLKWVGSKILWVIRRNETILAVQLATKFLPIPALDKIVMLVRGLDRPGVPGDAKMAEALESLMPILAEYDVEIDEESDLRFIIELAVKIMKERARIIENK